MQKKRNKNPAYRNLLQEDAGSPICLMDEEARNWINKEQISMGALTWEEQLKEIIGLYPGYYDCEAE